ncbi:MAG: transcriptional regulator [Beijerinckiaceae bacterium]|jgi:transcriptional regulator with XRE-family HTH domain|nr:transcriptional regulator [Beijerinckiaceae bacterium]
MTSEQLRAARALLRWEQKDLASASGVSLPSIKRIETRHGEIKSFESTLASLRSALESAGIEFLDDGQASARGGAGVRLRAGASGTDSEE